ncbi:MAG: DUF5667 domain-containing protein [Candidatus Nanohaloarchaea archaeon]|nr:DUF5667 domain-containing protein [Candidatus Nanohaloarchaea archaeon]
MKRLLFLAGITALLLAVGTAHAGHAHGLAVTPDHVLYDTKTAVEMEVEELAPNATATVQAKLEHAGKRVNETDVMADRNHTDLANQTANAYADKMQEVNDLGQEVSDLAQQQKIDELIATATMHHADVLSTVYEKVPEEAKKGISTALNRSMTGHQRAVAAMERRGQPTDGMNISAQIPADVRQKTGIGKPGDIPAAGGAGGNGSRTGGQGSGQDRAGPR